MKTLTITILLFLFKFTFCQSSYLSIIENEKKISYPPDTKFEVIDSNDKIILTEDSVFKKFEMNKDYILILYPNYKNTLDTFILRNGSIQLDQYRHIAQKLAKDKDYKNEVYFTKSITKSSTIEGRYNLVLASLSGLIFSYTDGKVSASYGQKKLKVVGKYYIKSELGTLKVSFNPINQETWWVFETKNNE